MYMYKFVLPSENPYCFSLLQDRSVRKNLKLENLFNCARIPGTSPPYT